MQMICRKLALCGLGASGECEWVSTYFRCAWQHWAGGPDGLCPWRLFIMAEHFDVQGSGFCLIAAFVNVESDNFILGS